MENSIKKLLDDVVHQYKFFDATLIEKINIGFDSQTYKIKIDSGIYFLSGTNDIALQSIREQQFSFVQHLQQSDIPVIKILKTTANQKTFISEKMLWYLMAESSGTSVYQYNEIQSYELGCVTGKLHEVGRTYKVTEPFNPDYYKQDINTWNELYNKNHALFNDAERNIIDQYFVWCSSQEITNIPYFYTHNDLFNSNILWSENKISSLIDFNSSRIAYYTEDFSKAFDSVIGDISSNNKNAIEFMKGYQKHFRMKKEHLSSIQFFLTLDLLKIISCWCRDYSYLKEQGKHPRDLIQYFEHIPKRLDFLSEYLT